MRDIRSDLKDRLADIEKDVAAAQARLSELNVEKALVSQMLEFENQRWQKPLARSDAHEKPTDGMVRSEYIKRLLADGNEWQHTDIRDKILSDGYLTDSDSPGRAVHAILVNLKRQGAVEQVGKGVWKNASGTKQNAEGPDAQTSEPSKNIEDKTRGSIFDQRSGLPPASAGED